jgi:coenzyme F420-reducing hydrogenase beta subunit
MPADICAKDLCTGCGACAVACPKQCISLKPDAQGHLLAVITEKACINCNLCRKICPVNTPVVTHEPQACYAGWAKEAKDRHTSSSGAAASVFSAHIIERGGVVYGAALQDNQIAHIRITHATDLPRLKGSKYVYSYACGVYAQIKQDLAEGKKVLFTGTSCQNAAVYNLIGENPNLILVNLICHGVPSMQMLKDHLKAKNITEIKQIQFRTDNKYELSCNEYKGSRKHLPDAYMPLFLKGITCRSSCYKCPYAKPERVGDITLGDFWGLGKKTPFKGGEVTKGCSVIIVNTEKGAALLNACADKLCLFKREYQEAVSGNAQLRGPVPYGRSVKLFNKFYPLMSFGAAAYLAGGFVLFKAFGKGILEQYAPKSVTQGCMRFYQRIKR